MIHYRSELGNVRPGRDVHGPSTDAERIEVADALRGFAVCGILFVNVLYFNSLYFDAPETVGPLGGAIGVFSHGSPALDRLAADGVLVFAQGKFYAIFSLLFGWGFAVQLGRAEREGRTARFPRLFARRLLVLGAIGAAHFVLLFPGDILMLYAVTGLALVCMRGARPEVLMRWAVGIIAVTAAFVALLFGWLEVARASGAAELAQGGAARMDGDDPEVATVTAVYAGFSFPLQIAFRVIPYVGNAGGLLVVPVVLAMFMAGFAAGRCDLLRRLAEHRAPARRVCAWCLAVGLPLSALAAAGMKLPALSAFMALWFNQLTAGPVVAIGYCAGIALLWQRPAWRRLLHPLTWLGRMALTNYLLQSAIAATLFRGYGLGPERMVSTAQSLLIVAAILAAQLAVSRWWLRRYRFGPAEWFWRTLTYGQAPPMRRAVAPPSS